jgi:hypothetical protein
MVNVRDSVASDTVVVTASGDGLIPSTVASSISFTSSAASGTVVASAATWQQGTGVATTGFKLVSQTSLVYPAAATSQSIGLAALTANGTSGETTATATKYVTVTVTDTHGAITGVPGTVYDRVLSQAGGGAVISSALSVTATLGTTALFVPHKPTLIWNDLNLDSVIP